MPPTTTSLTALKYNGATSSRLGNRNGLVPSEGGPRCARGLRTFLLLLLPPYSSYETLAEYAPSALYAGVPM